jgi:F-type H+-transporting ATPase subunit b
MADPHAAYLAVAQVHTEVAGSAVDHHVEPSAFGVPLLTPGFFVALAMLVVFAIMLKARVPALIAKGLDARISGIRQQLDEAAKLRAEAEALRDEYARKAREADADIAALRDGAEQQAKEIVAKAKADATALVARRRAMAEDKIAAAERAAIEEVRTRAATAAAAAARGLIAETHNSEADRKLIDQAIAGL